MVEWHDYYGLINELSRIPYDFEILEVFFENKSINWINCNGTSGWYDDKTGRWTGAVGKVKNKPKMAYSRDLPKMAIYQCGIMD